MTKLFLGALLENISNDYDVAEVLKVIARRKDFMKVIKKNSKAWQGCYKSFNFNLDNFESELKSPRSKGPNYIYTDPNAWKKFKDSEIREVEKLLAECSSSSEFKMKCEILGYDPEEKFTLYWNALFAHQYLLQRDELMPGCPPMSKFFEHKPHKIKINRDERFFDMKK